MTSLVVHVQTDIQNLIRVVYLKSFFTFKFDFLDEMSDSNERTDKVGSEATEIHDSSGEGEIIMGTIRPYDHEPLTDSDDDSENESDINEDENSRTSWCRERCLLIPKCLINFFQIF